MQQLGAAKGITLLRGEFNGSGEILQSTPEEDVEGGGWRTVDTGLVGTSFARRVTPNRKNWA